MMCKISAENFLRKDYSRTSLQKDLLNSSIKKKLEFFNRVPIVCAVRILTEISCR
jgi:hypothetical protein